MNVVLSTRPSVVRFCFFLCCLAPAIVFGAEPAPVVTVPGTNPPLISIQAFLDGAPTWGENIKIRLRGTVTHSISDKTFFIQEGTAGVYVFQKPERQFMVGEWVELVGSPSLGNISPTLQYCVTQAIGPGTMPPPLEIDPKDAFQHNMKLVRVRGRLSEDRLLMGLTLLVRLEKSDQVLSVELEALPKTPDLRSLSKLEPNSLLELTGVLALLKGPDRKPAGLRLFLRSANDIVVLAAPPFWTYTRIGQVLGFTLTSLLAAFLWILTLRGQVKRQTRLITERYDALKASENRFVKMFLASPEPVVLVRAQDESILDVNPAFGSLLGYSRAEVIGRTTDDLQLWVKPELRQQAIERIKQNHIVTNFECELRTRAGKILTCLGSAEEVNIDGQPCFLSVLRDVTERDRLAVQLQQAQKMESLGTLASGIAHDFNNIVGGILGSAEMMQHEVGKEHASRADLEAIRTACLRARDLVRQILAFSRQQAQEQRVVPLQPTVEEAIKLLRATIPASIAIQTEFDPDSPHVLADPGRIHQVVMNLGTNAWHAMETRPGRLTISLRSVQVGADTNGKYPDLLPGRYACLSVSDEGCGMDKETRDRIFDPFFTTKGAGKGTGLGLAVVLGIAKDHNGTIAVSSTPGQGTDFQILFPAAAANEPSSQSPETELPRGRGEHVLYIDDEEPLVLLATRSLSRLGYHVAGYTNPALGLAAFEENPDRFDAVMTDLNMPGTSGLEVVQRVRKLRPQLPTVLASGFLNDQTREKAWDFGVRAFLPKPHTIEDLAKMLHQVLGSQK